ncbi:MAG: antitoxin VapB family protein [Candidatus Sumerlaeota bacterium]|nr:antitoxin VapB family protein [Candidatus Sumerlaeota bacterium]
MAVKTITIDMEAYELLAREKRPNESFSKVIKRRLRPECTASELLRHLSELALDEDALDRVEEVVRGRAQWPAASPALDAGEPHVS